MIRKPGLVQATFIVFSLILTLRPNKIYAQTPAPTETYIINARIIDVEKKRIATGLTVVVRGDRIISIGKINAPKNASVLDATGNYLMPGMTDAHVHFFQSGGLYTRPDIIDLRKYYSYEREIKWTEANMEDQLRRYVQNGITTVYDAGATNHFLQQKNEFADKSFAPDIFMAGPLITSSLPAEFSDLQNNGAFLLVKKPEEASEAVRAELLYKPDLIKIWYLTDLGNNKSTEENARSFLPCVMAAIAEAHKNNFDLALF